MNFKFNKSIVLMSFPILSGCSVLSVGETDFSCKMAPGGIPCTSVQDAYGNSHGNLKSIPKNQEELKAKNDAKAKDGFNPLARQSVLKAPIKASSAAIEDDIFVEQAEAKPGVPKPTLEAAKVLRIWVAPWVDESETLHWPTHLFVEVTPRKWSYGTSKLREAKQLIQIQVEEGWTNQSDGKSKLTSPPSSNTPAAFSGMPSTTYGAPQLSGGESVRK